MTDLRNYGKSYPPELRSIIWMWMLMQGMKEDTKAFLRSSSEAICLHMKMGGKFGRTLIALERFMYKCVTKYAHSDYQHLSVEETLLKISYPDVELSKWRKGEPWNGIDYWVLHHATAYDAAKVFDDRTNWHGRRHGAHLPSAISMWLARTATEVKREMIRVVTVRPKFWMPGDPDLEVEPDALADKVRESETVSKGAGRYREVLFDSRLVALLDEINRQQGKG